MILDTTFVIDVMNKDQKAVQKLYELIKCGEPLMVTSLTIFELFSGLARSNKPHQEKNKVMQVLGGQLVLHLDQEAAEKAGEIDGSLIREGKGIGAIDSLIAGIALVKKEKVLTRNVKDFGRVGGLGVEVY